MVTAWLQSNVCGSTARCPSCRTQGMHFGMRLAGSLVPAFADDFAVFHQHAADARIGSGRVQATLSQAQRPGHPLTIGRIHCLSLLRRRVFLTASMASEKSPTSWKLLYTDAKRM